MSHDGNALNHNMDPTGLHTTIALATGIAKRDEFCNRVKSEWDVEGIRALLLEVCQQPRAGEVVDMETSICGNLKWEKMEPFDEYTPVARSEAEVYGLELRRYLQIWNHTRKTQGSGSQGPTLFPPTCFQARRNWQ
jgi:hypothetical protein